MAIENLACVWSHLPRSTVSYHDFVGSRVKSVFNDLWSIVESSNIQSSPSNVLYNREENPLRLHVTMFVACR